LNDRRERKREKRHYHAATARQTDSKPAGRKWLMQWPKITATISDSF
jgi:hypothetical protein